MPRIPPYNPKADILYLNKRIKELENRIAIMEITILNSGDKNNEENSNLSGPEKGKKRKTSGK